MRIIQHRSLLSVTGNLGSGTYYYEVPESAVSGGAATAVLDLTLPDGDGLSVLDDLKARNAKPSVTLAMTGHDDDITHARCMAAGCTDVLLKPVPINDLLRMIGEQVT